MTSFVLPWNFFTMEVVAESIPAEEHVDHGGLDQVLPHGSGPPPTLFAALKVLPSTI